MALHNILVKVLLLLLEKSISEPVLFTFYLSKEVESVLLLLPKSFFSQVLVLVLEYRT